MRYLKRFSPRLLFAAVFFVFLFFSAGDSRALVDMKNANFSQTWVDMSPLDGGKIDAKSSHSLLWFGIVRTYNSRSLMSGRFGFGWCSELETRLKFTAVGSIKLVECGGGMEREFVLPASKEINRRSIVRKIINNVQQKSSAFNAVEQLVGGFDPSLYTTMEDYLLHQGDRADELAIAVDLLPQLPYSGEYRVNGTGVETIQINGQTLTVYSPSSSLLRTFDRKGRLIGISDGRRAVSIKYKGDLPVRINDDQGAWLEFEFGKDNLIKSIKRFPGGYESNYEHDPQGDLRNVNNAWGKPYSYEYDKFHNMVRATWPDKTFLRIDYDAERDWVIGFRGRTGCLEDYALFIETENHYATLATTKCPNLPAFSNSYEFWHEADSNGVFSLVRVKVRNREGLRDIRYNHNGRPISVITDTSKIHFEYFPNGLLRSRTSENKRWNFLYGADQKMSSVLLSQLDISGKVVNETMLTGDSWPDPYIPPKIENDPQAVAQTQSVSESDERPSQFAALRATGEYERAAELLLTWDKEAQHRLDSKFYRTMVAQSAMVLASTLRDTQHTALSLRLGDLVLEIAGELHSVPIAPPVSLMVRIQQRAGELDKAIETINAGLSVLAGRPLLNPADRAEKVQLLRLLADLELRRYYPAKALLALRSARSVDPSVEEGDITIARIFAGAGLYNEARRIYGTNMSTFWAALGHDGPTHGQHETGVEQIYSDLQDLALSMGQDRNALTINEARMVRVKSELQPDPYVLASLLSQRGTILVSADRYDEALRASDEALTLVNSRAQPEPSRIASVLAERALIEDRLGESAKAATLLGRAIELKGANMTWARNQGSFLSALGRFDEAHVLYRQAQHMMLERLPKNHPDLANLAWSQADTRAQQGQFNASLRLLEPTIAAMRSSYGPGHWRTARALNTFTEVLLKMGNFPRAYSAAVAGLQAAGQSNSIEQLWRANHLMSKALAGRGQREAAIFFGKRAVNDIQALRHSLLTLDAKVQSAYGKSKNQVYRDLAALLIEEGRLPEAQQILTMFKENELQEFTRRQTASDARTTRADLTDRQATWSKDMEVAFRDVGVLGAELNHLETLQRLGAFDQTARARRDELRLKVDVAQAAFARVIERISEEAKSAARQHESELQERMLRAKTGLRTLMNALSIKGQSRTVCLQYLVTETKLYILITTPEVQFVRTVGISAVALNRAIDEFRQVLLEPQTNPVPAARALYAILVAPVREDLDRTHADTLMLSLMGALRYVPFAALHDGSDYLVRRFPVAILTDAAITQGLEIPKFEWNVAALGVAARVSQEFDPLPAVLDELKYIVKSEKNQDGILPGEVYIDGAFTAERYRKTVDERPSVIHIASHFKFASNSDLRSFLLLGDGSRLSLRDMMRDSYRFSGLDLLALSACETGLGGGSDSAGREIESLATLAQNQGASAVLASLWPVVDRSTSILMDNFYKTRQSRPGVSKAESLRQAQLQLLDGRDSRISPSAPRKHPFFWAPFVLFGNWL